MKAHQSPKLKEILQDHEKSDALRKSLIPAAGSAGSSVRGRVSDTGVVRISVGHTKTTRCVKKSGK